MRNILNKLIGGCFGQNTSAATRGTTSRPPRLERPAKGTHVTKSKNIRSIPKGKRVLIAPQATRVELLGANALTSLDAPEATHVELLGAHALTRCSAPKAIQLIFFIVINRKMQFWSA